MKHWNHLKAFHTVRLNATLFPVNRFESERYRKYQLNPIQVEAYTPTEIIPRVADCDALFVVSTSLPKAVIDSLSRCRVISRLGAGTDKIDVVSATRKGILVTNAPEFCVEEQADHTMALLLALERKLPQMAAAMVDGAWSRAKSLSRGNQRLSGRVIGLVGFGNSARAVARRASGFGLRVIATRRNLSAPHQEADALGVRMVTFDRLLAESDYVSLHLPLNDETYYLLNEAALRKMKPGAYLINTSRGALVDEMALVDGLRSGRLAGAGLDTFEHIDPFTEVEGPPDHPLLTLNNVVLTPHVASFSIQASQDVSTEGIQNVVSILSGRLPAPENIVNREVIPRFPLAEYDASLFDES